MKKRALMALPKLTATDEMKQIATSDLPRKEKTDYGYVREVCEYYTYLRCIKQDGILKVAFFFPEHLRLDGRIRPMKCIWIKKSGSLLPITA